MAVENTKIQVLYNSETDLLYLHPDDWERLVVDKRVSKNIVLDIGAIDRIIRIESWMHLII